MDALQQDVIVKFHFPVHFTTGVFGTANPVLRHVIASASDALPASAVVVLDDGVAAAHPGLEDCIRLYAQHHSDAITIAGPVLVVPGGERVKNDSRHVDHIHRAIHDAALCRHSFVVAVGGGAVLDAVGYAAATAHRGIRLIRVPTTVLSQDDSAVGVKNGINGFGKKNYFGTFAPPFAVINDFAFLATLEDRDWRSGLAEAVKAALIKDAAFFDELERHAAALVARDGAVMERVIRRSAALHLNHIAHGGDPFELGSSRPLDFGHWAAHRLEHLSSHRLRHGEAVAIGVALDCTYSYLTGRLAEHDWRRVIAIFGALHLAISAPELAAHRDTPRHPDSVLRGIEEFREHLGGELTLMLLSGIGCSINVHEIDTKVMIRSIDVLESIASGKSAEAAVAAVLSMGTA